MRMLTVLLAMLDKCSGIAEATALVSLVGSPS